MWGVVSHSRGEYARGAVHTNNCEVIISLFKPWMAWVQGDSEEEPPPLSPHLPESPQHEEHDEHGEDGEDSKSQRVTRFLYKSE